MFGSRARSCGILIEKPKCVVFVCKSFADFAEIPLAWATVPISCHISAVWRTFVCCTLFFWTPGFLGKRTPHTLITVFSSASVLPHRYTTLFTEKPAAGGFSLLTLVSHWVMRGKCQTIFFNGSQNLPCLFARNSQKNQEFVIFVLLPCQQCCPGNWSQNWPDFVQVLCFIWQWGSAGREHLK